MNSSRMYSFLHCPVQSGSDSVLADMKREYCIDDFKHVIEYLRDRYYRTTNDICMHGMIRLTNIFKNSISSVLR